MTRTRNEQYRRVNDARINELQAKQRQHDLNPFSFLFDNTADAEELVGRGYNPEQYQTPEAMQQLRQQVGYAGSGSEAGVVDEPKNSINQTISGPAGGELPPSKFPSLDELLAGAK